MSGAEDSFNDFCQIFESQNFEEGVPSLSRRESETSDTSQTSTMTGTRRRSKPQRLPRLPRVEVVEVPTGKRPVYPKVRTGCDTCKQRKIKCDETKPVCRNCVKSERQCMGYHPPTPKIFQPSRLSRQDPENEARLVKYFTTVVAKRLSDFKQLHLDLNFWQITVPTLAADCPPLRHAMLSFAAIQERYDTRHPKDISAMTIAPTDVYFALEQYTEVLRKVNSGITAASITTNGALICCLLLSLCDLWHLGGPQSFKHVFGGLELCKIVKKISPAKSPLPETTEINGAMLVPAFQYFADCAALGLVEPTDEQRSLLKDFEDNIDPVMPSKFGELTLAYASMDRALLQIGKALHAPEAIRYAKLFDIQGYLNALQISLEESLQTAEEPQDNLHLHNLLLHGRMARMLTDISLVDSEKAYDSNADEFESIITKVEDLLSKASSEPLPGLISLLFLTATKCRDTRLREQALTLLHNSHQLERSWTSCTAHQIAKQVIALELQGRVELAAIHFDVSLRQIKLTFLQQVDTIWREDTISMPWLRDEDQISAIHKIEPYTMQKLVRIGGYSALPWAYRQHGCHCGNI